MKREVRILNRFLKKIYIISIDGFFIFLIKEVYETY